jgi:hypothetical protein
MNRCRALALRGRADALEKAGIVQYGFVGEVHRVLRNSERMKATRASARSLTVRDRDART